MKDFNSNSKIMNQVITSISPVCLRKNKSTADLFRDDTSEYSCPGYEEITPIKDDENNNYEDDKHIYETIHFDNEKPPKRKLRKKLFADEKKKFPKDENYGTKPNNSTVMGIFNEFIGYSSKIWKRKSCIYNAEDIMDTVLPKKYTMDYVPNVLILQQKLTAQRYIECIKLIQATNVLEKIKPRKFLEQITAEKILLQSGAKANNLLIKISELDYSEVVTRKSSHLGTITLSDFKFVLKDEKFNCKFKYFYIIMLSNGTEVLISKAIGGVTANKIVFDESFTFPDIKASFHIKVQLYCIRLKQKSSSLTLKRKKSETKSTIKIFYEDIHLGKQSENQILQSSFKLIGEVKVNKKNLNNSDPWPVNIIEEDYNLQNYAIFDLKVDKLSIQSHRENFVTFATLLKENLFWERKWCTLKDNYIKLYNYPQDDEPVYTFNLKSLVQIESNPAKCMKNKTICIVIGPELRQLYFNFDSSAEFKDWFDDLHSILESLKDWKCI